MKTTQIERLIRLENDVMHLQEDVHVAINQTLKECNKYCRGTHEILYARINALELTNARLFGITTGVACIAAVLSTIFGLILQIILKTL